MPHVRMYEYFGGVPRITIPDNTKTAVITPDLVDPVLNKSYNEMAQHYRTTLVPARAKKPKDKAADENDGWQMCLEGLWLLSETDSFLACMKSTRPSRKNW